MSEPVIIVDYDPAWPARFAAEAERLAASLNGSHRIEHIGSTAVNGLAAKSIIDIMIVVDDPAILDVSAEQRTEGAAKAPIEPAGNGAHLRFVRAITRCGFTYRGENLLPERLYFKRPGPNPTHVHVAHCDSRFAQDHLLFRDWLRANPEDAAAYGKLKRGLAEEFREDREAYTRAKSKFIRGILRRARGAARHIGEV